MAAHGSGSPGSRSATAPEGHGRRGARAHPEAEFELRQGLELAEASAQRVEARQPGAVLRRALEETILYSVVSLLA